jgi:spermidine synthase
VVEINPQVEFVARQFFKLPDDAQRLDVLIGCGADYMLSGGKTFDCILVDGFDPEARTGPLDTLPFYQACRARLSDKGLLGVNLLGRDKTFPASVERLRQAFDQRVAVFPSCDSGNTIAFATGGEAVDVAGGDARTGHPAQEGLPSRPAANDLAPATLKSLARRAFTDLICSFLILQIPGLQRR